MRVLVCSDTHTHTFLSPLIFTTHLIELTKIVQFSGKMLQIYHFSLRLHWRWSGIQFFCTNSSMIQCFLFTFCCTTKLVMNIQQCSVAIAAVECGECGINTFGRFCMLLNSDSLFIRIYWVLYMYMYGHSDWQPTHIIVATLICLTTRIPMIYPDDGNKHCSHFVYIANLFKILYSCLRYSKTSE